ncbi:MAG: response regulator transcription factor [Acidimicrobiaceae bacterium]|nr:response regulator transcription factor [Acidimicrobiaceae bacterium]
MSAAAGGTIRVVVVDDHDLLREGVTACLDGYDDIEVVGTAHNGVVAVDRVVEMHPDVVVMDLIMPGGGGVEAIAEIARRAPETRVLALTSFTDGALLRSALEAGATSFQLKSVTGDDLAASIRFTAAGQSAMDSSVTRLIASDHDVLRDLTDREREVADLLATGLSNAEIAERLYLSIYTVKNHVSNILMKFNVQSRTELVAMILNARYQDRPKLPPRPYPGSANPGGPYWELAALCTVCVRCAASSRPCPLTLTSDTGCFCNNLPLWCIVGISGRALGSRGGRLGCQRRRPGEPVRGRAGAHGAVGHADGGLAVHRRGGCPGRVHLRERALGRTGPTRRVLENGCRQRVRADTASPLGRGPAQARRAREPQ